MRKASSTGSSVQRQLQVTYKNPGLELRLQKKKKKKKKKKNTPKKKKQTREGRRGAGSNFAPSWLYVLGQVLQPLWAQHPICEFKDLDTWLNRPPGSSSLSCDQTLVSWLLSQQPDDNGPEVT